MIWAPPLSLATTRGIVIYFLFLWVIRCFSSPGSPDIAMDLQYRITTLLVMSSLIRISAGLRSFAAHHSFSQLVTSFFGAMYQGILLYALCSLFFRYISISVFSLIVNLFFLNYKKIINEHSQLLYFRINLLNILITICLLYFVLFSSIILFR